VGILQLRRPGTLLGGPEEHRLGVVGQVTEELGVAAARLRRLPGRFQPLEGELANRLQHPVTRGTLVRRLDAHDALAD
jgi:hypothetical protein